MASPDRPHPSRHGTLRIEGVQTRNIPEGINIRVTILWPWGKQRDYAVLFHESGIAEGGHYPLEYKKGPWTSNSIHSGSVILRWCAVRTDVNMRSAKGNSVRGAHSKKECFTLLEVLVAFVLLATTVTVILQLFSSGIKALSVSENYATAVIRQNRRWEKYWTMISFRKISGVRHPGGIQVRHNRGTNLWNADKRPAFENPRGWRHHVMEHRGKNRSLTLNTMKTVKPQV